MPVPSNTTPANAIAMTVNVIHTTVAADVELAPDSTGYTSNCKTTNPQYNALWFKYTLPVGVNFFSFGISVLDSAAYNPVLNVWTETSPGVFTQKLLDWQAFCYRLTILNPADFLSFFVVGNPGDTFYFQVQNENNVTVDADLKVVVRQHTDLPITGECVIVPDDHYPYPAAVISFEAQDIISYIHHKKWAGEIYSVIQATGHLATWFWMTGVFDNGLTCYGPPPTWNEIGFVDLSAYNIGAAFGGDTVSDQISKHYTLCHKSGVWTLVRIDAATATLETTWTLPESILFLIGVHTASGIAYFSDGDNYSAIKRYDLNTNTLLSDFVANDGKARSYGFVLPNGTVGIYCEDEERWTIYNSSGGTLATYVREWHRFALDNTLNGIWYWEDDQKNFTHASILTGITDKTIYVPKTTVAGGPDYDFGFATSCPVITFPFPASVEPVIGAGIYELVPEKLEDTIYSDPGEENVTIPNPFAKTAYIGS